MRSERGPRGARPDAGVIEPGPDGIRCERCRTPDTVPVPRDWPAPADREPEASVSPGQWTQDLRGGTTGADWDATDWRNYGRIEDEYRKPVELLMSATDDEEAMRLWAGGPGWAGLIRALFLTVGHPQELIISRHSSTDPVDDDAVAGRRHGWGLCGDGVCAAAG